MESNDKMGNAGSEFEPNFGIFLTSLGMQAMIFLGEMPNPANNETKVDIARAKYMIDSISMIKDKTQGNLSAEEQKLIDDILYGLRLKYAEKNK
jgi:hypothetical protein